MKKYNMPSRPRRIIRGSDAAKSGGVSLRWDPEKAAAEALKRSQMLTEVRISLQKKEYCVRTQYAGNIYNKFKNV
jgi:hypothetical protein